MFTVVVTDDGTPNLNDSETITVTVNEVNTAPVLDPVGDQTIDEETLVHRHRFTLSPRHFDLHPQRSPAGSNHQRPLDPHQFKDPASTCSPSSATDDGTPDLNDSETITVTVNE